MILPGFSEHESAIIQALSAEPGQTAYALSKTSGVNRGAVAEILPKLLEQKIVGIERKGRRTVFKIANTEAIKARATEVVGSLAGLLEANQPIKILRGPEIHQIFSDLVRSLGKNEIFYRYIACGSDIETELYVPKDYRAVRDQKMLQQIAITSAFMKTKPYKKGLGCLWKVLPGEEDAFAMGAAQIIYGNKVALIDYRQEIAYVIENPILAQMSASIHKALYRRLAERVV